MKKTEFEYLRNYLLRSFAKTFPNRDYSLMQSMIHLMIIAKVKNDYDNLKTNQDWVDYAYSIENEFLNRFDYKLNTFRYIKNDIPYQLMNPFECIKLKNFDFDFNFYFSNEKTKYIADDYLGFTYQFFLCEYEKGIMQSNCSYYTSTQTIDRLIKTYLHDAREIYDPFCGTGRVAFTDLYHKTVLCGSDYDKPAVDLANLNHWLLNPEDDFIRFEHKDFYEISHKQDFIFTNIPFSKSIKIEADILNKIEVMTGYKAIVIIPLNHLERMEKFLNNKNWTVKERLNVNEFEPFTKVCCDVISLEHLNS